LARPEAHAGAPPSGLAEAARLWWREDPSERTLLRDERLWTVWSSMAVIVFVAPAVLLLWLEPLTFPVAAVCLAHAWAIPMLYARRGARSVVPIGSEASAARLAAADPRAERVALGLLGDLVGHAARDLALDTGLVLERGGLGAWLVGERGALLVRPGGHRVDSWCVRIAEPDGLPAGDRVAHLLLALREDELGFAKVANLDFSGSRWRIRLHLEPRARPALRAARRLARSS
jgi:hypothetical protein